MTGIVGLHHVQLAAPVGSEERLRWFYGTVLGLPEAAKPPELAARGGVWFRSADVELHLGVEEAFRPARKAHPGLLVEDLDGLARRLEENGVDVEWDDCFPGFRRCYVADPHGNRLELLEPHQPGRPFSEGDRRAGRVRASPRARTARSRPG